MPRTPTSSDFDAQTTVSIVPPPEGQATSSALVLLHGLGDGLAPFVALARQLALPETACVSVQGPTPLPFDLGGFHWGDDIVFDQGRGGMDFDTGFRKAIHVIASTVVRDALMDKCGFDAREIVVFGFGQGGMAALAAAKELDRFELGGIVSVGGPLPESARQQEGKDKAKTPVFAAGGSSQSLITTSAVRTLRDAFADVQSTTWPRPGDGMPGSRDEMYPIMHFLSRRLRSQAGKVDGAIELG